MFIEIPNAINIRGDRVIYRKAFEEFQFNKKKSDAQIVNEENLRNSTPSGHINRKIRYKMCKIIYNWIASVNYVNTTIQQSKKRKFTFVTLTLPSEQMHTDKELHRLALNTFIIEIKRKYAVVNYLWRAERQKNGNLHYHIIVDNYIHHSALRLSWNKVLNNLGYINKYRLNQQIKHSQGFKLDTAKLKYWKADNQLKAYLYGKGTNWSNPNTTDIHSLKKIKDASKYIMKYVSKSELIDNLELIKTQHSNNEITAEQYEHQLKKIMAEIEKEKIHGRVWGCSDQIKNLTDTKIIEDSIVVEMMHHIETDKATKKIIKDSFVIFYNNKLNEITSQFKSIAAAVGRNHLNNYHQAYSINFKAKAATPLNIDLSEDLSVKSSGYLMGLWVPLEFEGF